MTSAPRTSQEPVRLNSAHIALATPTFVRAFHDDPLYVHFFPDVRRRERVLPVIFRFRLRYGIECGVVYATSAHMEGVAIWLSSASDRMTPGRLLRTGGLMMMLSAGSEARKRMQSAIRFAGMVRARHANFPHWHLSPIVVDPAHQGKGYAGVLICAMLARLDSEGMPVFLETQTERNVAIYERYGFVVVERVTIPGTSLTHWAMLRRAPRA